ncbi:MAG: molybdopterin-dependent oxidoreductase [Thiobacillus sp.]|nr:molybdopterin-dependent oxidoreductase [Thiobacillus sp.]
MADNPTPIHTTCPYCGVGCGILVSREPDDSPPRFSVRGDPGHPANLGRLCSKGAALAETLGLEDRLLVPEVAGKQVGWDQALDTVAHHFRNIIEQHGPDAVAFYVSGQLLTEDYYVANKLMKGFIGSGNIDTNSRLCMSSAVAGHKRAFGTDTVPACYEDLEIADLVTLVGSNAAWAHPVAFQRIVAARKARPGMKVVVIDPRRTATCDIADLHLAIAPGADAWLFNGLLNHLRREGGIDWSYLESHVEGFGSALDAVDGLNIPQVAAQCGLAEAEVAEFYRLFTTMPKAVTVFSQGTNQSSSGVDKANSIINAHLASGRVGKPGASPFSITGQPNAMGGREVGGLANQLAAHMDFDPADVARVGRFWNSHRVASKPGLKAVDMFEAVREGRIKAVWIMATNPAVSLPQADRAVAALKQCEFVVVSEVAARTDTSIHAHVRLPAAAWGEKDGTVTNSERRISRQRAFMPLPGEARPDWWIVDEVAKRLGYRQQFDYAGTAEIFAEHAALSGFENEGSRDFDISGLLSLYPPFQMGGRGDSSVPVEPLLESPPPPLYQRGEPRGFHAEAYDTLLPIQWPVTSGGGTPRLFADGHFHTPSGKARMIAITPRPPAHAPDADHPFVFNTGRIRDQWHTMTRTGKTAKLLAHIAEPFVEMHPADARKAGVADGGLARVHNAHGEMVARVMESQGQRPGAVFSPIHWNGQFSGRARVGVLVNAVVDGISGQPEFKHAPVAVAPYAAGWHGFVISRRPLARDMDGYWTRVRAKGGWRHELAGPEGACPWPEQVRNVFGEDSAASGDWIELRDAAVNRYRAALLRDGRLEMVCFFERDAAALPPRHWLEALLDKDSISGEERTALLMGRPGKSAPDCGRIVCACFGVGENDLDRAIAAGAKSVEALGIQLKAGTNCGSCIPELKALLQAG